MALHRASTLGCDSCLGYMPGSPSGYPTNMGLGALDTSGYDAGEAANIPDSVLSYLDDIGATDADVNYLVDGEETLTEILANYGSTPSMMPTQAQLDAGNSGLIARSTTPITQVATYSAGGTSSYNPSNTGSSAAAANTALATAPSSIISVVPAPGASSAQSKPGTTLSSTIVFPSAITLGTNLTASANGLIAALQSALPSYGMTVQNSSSSVGVISSSSSVTITILDSIGHNLLSDIQSVLASLAQSYLGTPPTVSIAIVSSPTGASGSGATVTSPSGVSPTSLSAWVENNAGTIGVGVITLVIGGILLSKVK